MNPGSVTSDGWLSFYQEKPSNTNCTKTTAPWTLDNKDTIRDNNYEVLDIPVRVS